MNRLQFFLALSATLLSTQVFALSPEAAEGKKLFSACQACHDQTLDPPLGPPMWGVQRRYKNSTLDDEDFIDSIVAFVQKPSLENARHNKAVERMGLMPPLPMQDEALKKIATYILEEKFPPPCAHWAIGVKLSTEKGDLEHAQKDQRMLDRFCN
jgi:mono/diheme cytochrome c family protein